MWTATLPEEAKPQGSVPPGDPGGSWMTPAGLVPWTVSTRTPVVQHHPQIRGAARHRGLQRLVHQPIDQKHHRGRRRGRADGIRRPLLATATNQNGADRQQADRDGAHRPQSFSTPEALAVKVAM